MIKINTNNFDMDSIDEVYNDLANKILKKLKKNEEPRLAKKFISERLLSCNLDILDKSYILNYLYNGDLKTKQQNFEDALNRANAFTDIYKIIKLHLGKQISKQNKEQLIKMDIAKKNLTDDYEIYNELVEIFKYETLTNDLRHKLVVAMNVAVCPYCNRQYITNYKRTDGRRPTATLDHFYPKSKYPHFALSLYNLVPSCSICNTIFKKDTIEVDDEILNPYESGFDNDAKFTIKGIEKSKEREDKNSAILDHMMTNSNVEISIKSSTNNKKIKKSIELFHLNDVYKTHADYAKELVKKEQIYNNKQIYEFLANYKDIFGTMEEIKLLIFGNYTCIDDLDKRPLSKLTKDILDELGNIR